MSAPEATSTELRALRPESQALPALVLGAIGVVFGDIGTSPLYAMREIFAGAHPLPVTPDNVLGILSLVFWSLMLVVSVKYVSFIMNADNRGEGGIMAMLSLVHRATLTRPRLAAYLTILGVFGAALFYGDGMLTPAISVLSAVEGLKIATPHLESLVLPISVVILVALFLIQKRGTEDMGRLFGPITLVWFLALLVLGAKSILLRPEVLAALSPTYAVGFFLQHGWYGVLVLGGVVLAVTGAEALYADMGHFGKQPIRYAWYFLVLPALVINYFGQGALMLAVPDALENPFYRLAPHWALYPMVGLATAATVIASQAVISGAFSVTQQAIQLGFLPRMDIQHTSKHTMGQIYVPFMNWLLLAGVLALVFGFGSSTAMAPAYGMAVTGTMAIDTLLGFVVATYLWRWNRTLTIAGLCVFLCIDLAFLGANSVKLIHGGWFPLAVGSVFFVFLTTWKAGRKLLHRRLEEDSVPLVPFLEQLRAYPPTRIPGMAVFLTTHPDIVPRSLLHNLSHNKVLHRRVAFVTVATQDIPFVHRDERIECETIGEDLFRIRLHYGFMQRANIPRDLARCRPGDREFNLLEASFFLSRETLIPTEEEGMAGWRKHLFIWMSRNAQDAMSFFRIPTGRVVELGSQVRL